MILKGLVGLIIGIGFGLLNGGVTFFLWRVTHDPNHPGPMIPDDNGWGLIATIAAAFIAGICGALVGLIVSLSGVNKGRGGIIGFAVGATVLLLATANSWADTPKPTWHQWQMLMKPASIYLLLLPISSALMGIVVSFVTSRLRSR